MKRSKKSVSLFLVVMLVASIMCLGTANVSAATNQFRGVNWADTRDNFQPGVIYVSDLTSSDTYSSASTVADRVMSEFISKLGANSVRLPINEATVSSYWGTYTGAIDTLLSKGKVILCYWSNTFGTKPPDINAFWNMWTTVVNKYGSNSNCYFEIYNEPNAYSKTDLGNLYDSWLKRYTSVPQNRVILDGTGMAQNVSDIGSDSRFNGCLLAVHEYSMWGSTSWTAESQWISQFQGYVGNYADRTVCTEWGGPMSPGTKNGIYYGYQDYNSAPGSYFVAYLRGITSQLRTWNMGSFYWAGLKDGDWYSMTTKSGSGSGITLTVSNQSGLDRMKYSWGDALPGGGTTNQKIKNVATGLYIDGVGATTGGSAAKQYSSSTSTNQQWVIETVGSNVKIKNVATGMYLDGAGNTTNGSTVKQYASSTSNNQQWVKETVGSYVKFKNVATGLYLDGMGRTTSGSELGQWSSSSSTNQQWELVAP